MPTERTIDHDIPEHKRLTANDSIRWTLYTLAVLIWFLSQYEYDLPAQRHMITISVIFLTGALVLRGLRPKPQPKEKST